MPEYRCSICKGTYWYPSEKSMCRQCARKLYGEDYFKLWI